LAALDHRHTHAFPARCRPPDARARVRARRCRAGFAAIQLIYFFTAGEDEVKCWTLRKGMKAPQAAGTIHTDFEKGFICAEVMAFEELKEAGTESAVKAKGRYRQEGKMYVVADGDVILFKFGWRVRARARRRSVWCGMNTRPCSCADAHAALCASPSGVQNVRDSLLLNVGCPSPAAPRDAWGGRRALRGSATQSVRLHLLAVFGGAWVEMDTLAHGRLGALCVCCYTHRLGIHSMGAVVSCASLHAASG
jgi:hypothetical protein